MNRRTLKRENGLFRGTPGVSQGCREQGFQAAFRDQATGRVELSRQRNGEPAGVHIISWLPREWARTLGGGGAILALKSGIESGFVKNGVFYTREEAAGARRKCPTKPGAR